jgi:hypothetical protein
VAHFVGPIEWADEGKESREKAALGWLTKERAENYIIIERGIGLIEPLLQ